MTVIFLTENNSIQNIDFGIQNWLLKLDFYFVSETFNIIYSVLLELICSVLIPDYCCI